MEYELTFLHGVALAIICALRYYLGLAWGLLFERFINRLNRRFTSENI